MNLAVSSGCDSSDLIARLTEIEVTARIAQTQGVKLICWPEWFFGVEAVQDFRGLSEELSDIAAEYSVAMVTGNVLTGDPEDGLSEHILAIEADGTIILDETKVTPYQLEEHNYHSGNGLNSCDFSFGRTVILNGLDAIDSDLLHKAKSLAPRLVILQINPSSALEAEALRELAISVSQVLRTVVCMPMLAGSGGGPAAGAGTGGFVANDGAIVDEIQTSLSVHAGAEQPLMVSEIDFETVDPIPNMGTKIEVPELLRQRYLAEVAGGNPLSDLEKNN